MRRRRGVHGFTLVELLVVISIIVVLLGILLPVVGNLRKQAHAANTNAFIAQLGAQIQAYYADHRAYPGPVPNSQLRGAAPNNITLPATVGGKLTMAENLFLGLLGGLTRTSNVPAFSYDVNIAGQGPRNLGTIPKKYPPYGDNTGYTRNVPVILTDPFTGDFKDEVADCDDSAVPEFLDRFPDAMPLLYLRARPGAVGVVSATSAASDQYDQMQVTPYTGPAGGPYIGVGKEEDGDWTLTFPQHGFNAAPNAAAVTTPGVAGYEYPYNIYAALRHPTVTGPTGVPVAKQKDGYILISAGIDRVYGTRDDITNFGPY